MAADDDIMAGVKTKWLATAALIADVADGPKIGAIPSPLAMPYVHMECQRSQEPEYSSGGFFIYWGRLTLCVYAARDKAVSMVGNIAATFEGAYPGGAKTLTVPNSVHMATIAEDPGRVERDETMKDAGDVWKGTCVYIVMIQRTVP